MDKMTINKQIDYIKQKLTKYTSDSHLIDELTQIISIKLYQRSYNYYNEYQHKKLLSLLIRSAYIDFYRKKKEQIVELVSEMAKEEPVTINSNILFSSIDKLPEKQKEVIILRYYFGLKYDKISQLFNCSKNTALSYCHKAKNNLSKSLTKNQVYEF